MKKYPLAKPYIGDKEKKAVCSVLDSGILSLGPIAVEFERRFARRVGTKYACAVSSGTAGLHLSLIAAGIKSGDEVITSPFSFIASANAIIYVGAKPVFADIDSRTGNIDPEEIEKHITPKTTAILVVHIFGHPADMTRIMRIANRHKLIVIEDACEALGAVHNGKNVGTFGSAAVFAFYANKQITTGEGGMITTNDRSIYELCLSLRNQGRSDERQWLEHERLGYNYRMDELSAALGVVQLDRFEFMTRTRTKIAHWYERCLGRLVDSVEVPQVVAGNIPSWFVYVVRLNNRYISRDNVIRDLERSGIATKPYLPSIHLTKFYRNVFRYRENTFPCSEKLSSATIALPFFIGLTKSDVLYIVETLSAILRIHEKRL